MSQSTARGSGTCPAERSGLASGLMMTGHEIGAALGVAALTAIAGNLATAAGLIDGYGRALTVTAVVLGALFVLTRLTVPADKPSAGVGIHGHGGHGHGHGHVIPDSWAVRRELAAPPSAASAPQRLR